MGNVFFTADLHFNHANILKYCNRPYSNAHEMNEGLIAKWNAKVTKNDTTYLLGDVAFGNFDNAIELLKRLNGRIILIKGNHDRRYLIQNGPFDSVHDLRKIEVGSKEIVLCHYPMREWDKFYLGTWMLHGHCHGTLPPHPTLPSFDVGVDCHNFEPISFEEVKQKMEALNYPPPKFSEHREGKS